MARLVYLILIFADPLTLGNSFFTSCIEAMIRSSCRPFLVLSLKELGMVFLCLHKLSSTYVPVFVLVRRESHIYNE